MTAGKARTREVDVAATAAMAAGRLLLEGFQIGPTIAGPVGRHDLAVAEARLAGQVMVEAIRASFPDDPIVDGLRFADAGRVEGWSRAGVPGGSEPPAAAEPRGGAEPPGRGPRRWRALREAERAWLLSSLDGALNAFHGLPIWSVGLALLERGLPVVSVVYDPNLDETIVAVRDTGLLLDGRLIRRRAPKRLSDAVIVLDLPGRGQLRRVRRIARAVRAVRLHGAPGLALAYVGLGRFDAVIQAGTLRTPDILPGALIAHVGAGRVGRISRSEAIPWPDLSRYRQTGGLLAARGGLFDELRELIDQSGADRGLRPLGRGLRPIRRTPRE